MYALYPPNRHLKPQYNTPLKTPLRRHFQYSIEDAAGLRVYSPGDIIVVVFQYSIGDAEMSYTAWICMSYRTFNTPLEMRLDTKYHKRVFVCVRFQYSIGDAEWEWYDVEIVDDRGRYAFQYSIGDAGRNLLPPWLSAPGNFQYSIGDADL